MAQFLPCFLCHLILLKARYRRTQSCAQSTPLQKENERSYFMILLKKTILIELACTHIPIYAGKIKTEKVSNMRICNTSFWLEKGLGVIIELALLWLYFIGKPENMLMYC